jgi:prepilin-type N-terminal cleavage/methylation domain-containing protein
MRRAFTMIELLVVLLILGILAALLLPAIQGAIRTAREAAVTAEINGMVQALAQFKSTYGDFPPSRIVLSENGDYTPKTLGGFAALGPRSTSYLRRFWPRAAVNASPGQPPVFSPAAVAGGSFYDYNGNGVCDTAPYMLSGPQCLVFFLGGVPVQTAQGLGMSGFGRNPVNPFQPGAVNRTVPLFDFAGSRLVIDPASTASGVPGYMDSIGGWYNSSTGNPPFYVYFSAYGGAGYDPDDCNMKEPNDDGTIQMIVGAFMTPNAATGMPVMLRPDWVGSPAPNPYVNDTPIPTLANGHVDKSNFRPRAYQNGFTFQIISPGWDRLYGIGGQHDVNASTRLPFVQASAGGYKADSAQTQEANADVTTGMPLDLGIRARERDNLTSFSTGRLD